MVLGLIGARAFWHSRAELSTVKLTLISRRVVGPAVAILGCGLMLFLLSDLSRGVDYHLMIHAVRAMPRNRIWLAILFTALSYLALIARDETAMAYLGAEVAIGPLLLASFCGSALGNAIGFGALTGEARAGPSLRRGGTTLGANR